MVRKIGGKDVATKDLFTKPNAAFALASGASFAFLPYLGAPGWLIGFVCLWLVLWLAALIDETVTYSKLPSWLEDQDFKQVYRWVVLRRFAWLWKRAAYAVPKRAGFFRTLNGALSYRVWEFSLRLSISYPFLLCSLPWLLTARDGNFGNETIFNGKEEWWLLSPERILITVSILSFLCSILYAKRFRPKESADAIITVAAFTILGLFLLASFAMSEQISMLAYLSFVVVCLPFLIKQSSIAAIISVGVAVFYSGALQGIFPKIALASVLYLTFSLIERLLKNQNRKQALLLMCAVVFGSLLYATVFGDWNSTNKVQKSVFIFMGVFPFINAFWDTISYALTLTLMRLGLRQWPPFFCAIIDFVCGCLIFLALGGTLTTALAVLNALSETTLVNTGATFDAIEAAPMDHLWVFAMLFSTLLPTAIHFALSLFGTQVFVPAVIRRAVAGQLRAARTHEFAAVTGPMLAGLIGTAPFAIVAGLGALIWHFGQGAALWLIAGYGDLLRGIASSIAAL